MPAIACQVSDASVSRRSFLSHAVLAGTALVASAAVAAPVSAPMTSGGGTELLALGRDFLEVGRRLDEVSVRLNVLGDEVRPEFESLQYRIEELMEAILAAHEPNTPEEFAVLGQVYAWCQGDMEEVDVSDETSDVRIARMIARGARKILQETL